MVNLCEVSHSAKRTIQTLSEQLHFSNGHGYCPTAIPEVMLFGAQRHEAACPLLYDRGLVFIFQGFKVGVVAGQAFRTGGNRYLILCNAQAVRCETLATSEEPLLGLHVGFNTLELQRLLQVLRDERRRASDGSSIPERALVSARLNGDIQRAVDELVDTLHDGCAAKALGPSCLTRFYFSVLKSEEGRVLEALALADSKLRGCDLVKIRVMDIAHGEQHVRYPISDQLHVSNDLDQRRAIIGQRALHGFDELTLGFDPDTKTTAILSVGSEIRIEQ